MVRIGMVRTFMVSEVHDVVQILRGIQIIGEPCKLNPMVLATFDNSLCTFVVIQSQQRLKFRPPKGRRNASCFVGIPRRYNRVIRSRNCIDRFR